MARRFLAFDIETAKVLPEGVKNLKDHRPLGITCAASMSSEDDEPRFWYGQTESGAHAGRMGQDDAAGFVDFLARSAEDGFTVLTWNGLGFDLDILAEESGRIDDCRRLARGHVDMMFHAFCELGYPIGLESVAQGMRIPGKSAGVQQHAVPQMWADGKTDVVLDYVAQDVRLTLSVAQRGEESKRIRWVARSGKTRDFRLPNGWLTVDAAMRLPKPDTSWMDKPMSRSDFAAWL